LAESLDGAARPELAAARMVADVAIIGGGPVGVCTAILLAQHGMTSIVVERHSSPYPLPRAVHIDDEVMRILHTAGVAEPFREVSRPGQGLRVVDRRLHEIVRFHRSESEISGFPQANMFHQPDLEAILRGRAARAPEVSLACGLEFIGMRHEFDRISVAAREVGSGRDVHISARYLLGCDGARSRVRAAIGARMVDLRFEQRWLVLDVAPVPKYAIDGAPGRSSSWGMPHT
jgi:3-(3-hydroxy-phenyl)propionate hydroxylase